MNIPQKRIKKIAIIISVIISAMVLIILSNIINLNIKKESQQERIMVLEQLINYKSKIEEAINSRISLVNGYLAFAKTYPRANKETTVKYVTNLIDPEDKLIKNISIIKDTTIVWTYPEKGNENVIGKDLTKISSQKESVLLAKNKGITVFQGPVTLIQGGLGFIIRIPSYDDKGKYWGQVSVVINGEELIKNLSNLEKEFSLKVSLYNKKDYPQVPFWGKTIPEKTKPLLFSTTINNAEWIIAAVPSAGWKNHGWQYFFGNLFVVLLTGFMGILVYNYINSSHQIKNQLNYDALTGVHSRAFLDSYEQIILSRAIRTKTKIGIIVIDLNDFKSINDKYGHLAGDKALQMVANNLVSSCRITDNVIRTGGDEFLMIFNDLKDREDFDKIIRKIDEKKYMTLKYSGNQIEFSYSAGVAMYPEQGETISEVINIADKKMYIEKEMYKKKGT